MKPVIQVIIVALLSLTGVALIAGAMIVIARAAY